MAYATSTDITNRYSTTELLIVSDRDGNGTADTNIIATALDDASAEIDAYLALRYTVPLSPAPTLLVRFCVEIAMYRMAENAAAMTKEKRQRYDDVIAYLKSVANSEVSLGVGDTETAKSTTIEYKTSPRLFTRETMDGAL